MKSLDADHLARILATSQKSNLDHLARILETSHDPPLPLSQKAQPLMLICPRYGLEYFPLPFPRGSIERERETTGDLTGTRAQTSGRCAGRRACPTTGR